LIGRGVRANVISPGPVATPLSGKLGLPGADLAAMKSGILGQIPAARFGQPEEIADAAVYFASD
jgi:NAD(P)-dependent dehydrogenase (short-subunit alcohol dehydrogenase family)